MRTQTICDVPTMFCYSMNRSHLVQTTLALLPKGRALSHCTLVILSHVAPLSMQISLSTLPSPHIILPVLPIASCCKTALPFPSLSARPKILTWALSRWRMCCCLKGRIAVTVLLTFSAWCQVKLSDLTSPHLSPDLPFSASKAKLYR